MRLKRSGNGKTDLTTEDHGEGMAPKPLPAGTGLGSKIIRTTASALQTHVENINLEPDTAAWLVLTRAV